MRRLAVCLGCVIVLLFAPAGTVRGGLLVYELTKEFSGATPPVGAAPWLTFTFDDEGTAGSVKLLLETTNLVGTEFVGEWSFNLDPALDPADLSFEVLSRIGTFDDPKISLAVNAYGANGDGYFDIKFDFAQPGNQERFGAGESIEYRITGFPGLTVGSFSHLSADKKGANGVPMEDGFITAAHVQGINDNYSGWVTTPEPSTVAVMAMGSLILLCRRRRGG